MIRQVPDIIIFMIYYKGTTSYKSQTNRSSQLGTGYGKPSVIPDK